MVSPAEQSAPAKTTLYRADIDGLRGLAVLAVVAFHFWPGLFPAGFLGVDVFFVISGYVIALAILREHAAQSFRFSSFYARRVKRIFPALLVVLCLTWIMGWVALPPGDFANLGKHIAAGGTFTSNFLLWSETGYFNAEAAGKPLLHLWSLGIEEQFYIFFPCALWLALKAGRKAGPLIGILLALSFAGCLYATRAHRSIAFYFPFTRLWEILLGCALASFESQAPRPGGWFPAPFSRECASILGLLLILPMLAGFRFHASFPGFLALLPTLGAALIVFGGRNAAFNHHVLARKPLVWLGLISYPLYLLHWPIYSVARILYDESPPATAILFLLAVSLFLSWLVYRFVERPIRFGAAADSRKTGLLCGFMLVLALVGLATASGRIPPVLVAWSKPVTAPFDAAVDDWDSPPDNYLKTSGFRTISAEAAANGGPPLILTNFPGATGSLATGKAGGTALFIGDSLIGHYWPRVKAVLTARPGDSRLVVFADYGGCPPLPGVHRDEHACDKLFDFAIEEAEKKNVGVVVFGGFWEGYFIGPYPDSSPEHRGARLYDKTGRVIELGSPESDRVFQDFAGALKQLGALGKEVWIILPSPFSSKWDPHHYRSRFHVRRPNREVMQIRRADFERFILPVKKELLAVAALSGSRTIDPLDYLEEDGWLKGRTPEGVPRYIDEHHLRPFYVRERATFIDSLVLFTNVAGGKRLP